MGRRNNMPKKKNTWVSRMKKNIKSLLGPSHSPAGKKHLKKAKPVYFKHIKRKSAETRLREAGLTDKELGALGYKK